MYQKLIAVLTVALMVSACGGDENNKATNNNTSTNGTNGPGTNGPGTNGPGTNGPGTNGPGTNGPGTNGPGTNGPGTNGPGESCGDVTEDGVCTSAAGGEFCYEGELYTLTCADMYPTASECTDFDGYADCGILDGEGCFFQDEDGEFFAGLCAGEDTACVLGEASACTAGITCEDPVGEANYVPTCAGNVLLVDCTLGRGLGLDCASDGGTCDATQSACVMPEGGDCDPSANSFFVCADGFTCTTDGDTSTCVAD